MSAIILSTEIGKNTVEFSVFFLDKMKPYLQCLYTIRELSLENMYKDFVGEFLNSKQYQVYQNISFLVDKTKRWSKTLEES